MYCLMSYICKSHMYEKINIKSIVKRNIEFIE